MSASNRDETFHVDRTGCLVRRVTEPASFDGPGRDYEHRCPLASLEEVAHTIDEFGEAGCVIGDVVRATGLPSTRVATAMAFMRERGILCDGAGRRNYPVGDCGVHLDTMTEYHALREEGGR